MEKEDEEKAESAGFAEAEKRRGTLALGKVGESCSLRKQTLASEGSRDPTAGAWEGANVKSH